MIEGCSVLEKTVGAVRGIVLMLSIEDVGFDVVRAKNSREKDCFWLLVKNVRRDGL